MKTKDTQNKHTTIFEAHLNKRYGKIGTESRTTFETKAKVFAIGEIIKEERKYFHNSARIGR
jgi:HTH-type transcriptional regulator/antitoxin HipB